MLQQQHETLHQLIFTSELYSILSYPGINAIELIDKVCRRSAFLRDDAAEKFTVRARKLFSAMPADPNDVDELIETCEGLMVHDFAVH